MHVTAVGSQIDDGVPDDLPWTVIRHITAPAGFVGLNSESAKSRLGSDDVGTAFSSDPERDDWRMLEQQQKIRNALGASLLYERRLKLQRLLI